MCTLQAAAASLTLRPERAPTRSWRWAPTVTAAPPRERVRTSQRLRTTRSRRTCGDPCSRINNTLLTCTSARIHPLPVHDLLCTNLRTTYLLPLASLGHADLITHAHCLCMRTGTSRNTNLSRTSLGHAHLGHTHRLHMS